MQDQQANIDASKQSHLDSESLNLEDLQDQNHVSISIDQNQSIHNQKNENEPQNANINEERNSNKSFASLKRELSKYKKLAEERQLHILKEQAKAREISSKLDAAVSLNQKYENELNMLREQKDEKKTDSTPSQNDDENINNIFNIFENALQSDADNLSELSSQRLNMFKICHSYQQCLEATDKEILNMKSQMQNQEVNNQINLLNDILQITQSSNQEESDQSPRDQILSIVQELHDKSFSQKETQNENDTKTNGQILGHLENALYFIRTLKNASPDEQNSLKDTELRKAITQQCKQIESFLAENKPEAVTSLFDNSNVDEMFNQTAAAMQKKAGSGATTGSAESVPLKPTKPVDNKKGCC